MAEQELFGELAVIGALAVATTLGLHRFGLPATIGFLITGAVAGPHGLGFVGDTEHITQIAEIGVILLLFAIGLEFSLSRLRFIWRAVAIGGSLQVGVTTAAALAILVLAGDTVERGLVFGLVVALSSTVVVLRVLDVRGELDAPHGRFIVGALIFQDLLVIPLTLLVPVLASGDSSGFMLEAGWALGRATLAVGAVLLVARYLVPRVFSAVDATRTREVFLLTVISIALGSAWLMNQIGLSFALGAFLAGILLADTDYSHRATSDIIPLRDAFTSFFFISLGMLVDWRVFTDEPVLAVLIVLGLVPGKALIASIAALAMRYPAQAAWRSGIYLAQFGEFGYVVLVLGASEGLITSSELRLGRDHRCGQHRAVAATDAMDRRDARRRGAAAAARAAAGRARHRRADPAGCLPDQPRRNRRVRGGGADPRAHVGAGPASVSPPRTQRRERARGTPRACPRLLR